MWWNEKYTWHMSASYKCTTVASMKSTFERITNNDYSEWVFGSYFQNEWSEPAILRKTTNVLPVITCELSSTD